MIWGWNRARIDAEENIAQLWDAITSLSAANRAACVRIAELESGMKVANGSACDMAAAYKDLGCRVHELETVVAKLLADNVAVRVVEERVKRAPKKK